MRDAAVPCRYATAYETSLGRHITFNDNQICTPCERTVDRFAAKQAQNAALNQEQVSVGDEGHPSHPSAHLRTHTEFTAHPMTVGALVGALSALDQDLIVYLARDAEGNGFESLWKIDTSYAVDNGDGPEPLHPDDVADYEESFGSTDDLPQAVFLWP